MNIAKRIMNRAKDECMVSLLLQEVKENDCKKCGKCVFGYEGVTQLEMALFDIAEKRGKSTDFDQMRALSLMMQSQSLCEIGEDLGATVMYAMDNHKEEFMEHISKKACRTGVCRKFMTYHILPDLCTGCTDCADVCDDDAIIGKKKFVHIIDQDECTQCGKCMEACDEDAIVTAGLKKPRTPKKPIPCTAK